ncbi:hypothetical protein FRX31_004043 [Thalictrum thalictroides]|uniref:Uncharacterized protein n=1 Tax=Thalictrum thalictroides TaxID=46969 RepID=A0A7J6XD46_THATH|nr:hypothetical protein FRX31_004043 [Thalictrum thalictroides]
MKKKRRVFFSSKWTHPHLTLNRPLKVGQIATARPLKNNPEQDSAMVTASSLSTSISEDTKSNLLKEVRSHEVAIAELNHLSASRAVYQKNGNIYFRTSIQKATASEQKNLDSAKAKLQK